MDAFLDRLDEDRFWAVEHDGDAPFRWTRPRFAIDVPEPRHEFVRLRLASPIAGGRLAVRTAAGTEELPLEQGWQTIEISTHGAARLELSLSEAFTPAGETRSLGVMLREALFHSDRAEHELLRARHANALLNDAEFRAGAEVLASFPTHLRITSSKRCNIANEVPCVYCSWDWAKRMEEGSPEFTPEVLADMGRFMDLAEVVNDCSYGEPPLEGRFGEVVDLATRGGRTFEFTSNGQTLGRKSRARLLGKPALVHVSIDAASAAGYRRYRDHRFELIIKNLRDLIAERQAHGGLPRLQVSFIAMRSNLAEIPAFIALMKDVGVDKVAFRTLYLEDRLDIRRLDHYGFHFDYDAECLGADELAGVAANCRALGEACGQPVIIEWEDFATNVGAHHPGEPICSEPWKTVYLLDRGIMPCCYGREAMVRWDGIDMDRLEGSLVDAFNSAPFRELRRDLAGGRLGAYCHWTQGCPIVKSLKHGSGAANTEVGGHSGPSVVEATA